MMKTQVKIAGLTILLVALCSCQMMPPSQPSPLTYLALEKPKGVIKTTTHKGVALSKPRGGFYVGNLNFRPAADIQGYVQQCQTQASASILRNADIQLNVPFAFDVLFFGYNRANDSVTVAGLP